MANPPASSFTADPNKSSQMDPVRDISADAAALGAAQTDRQSEARDDAGPPGPIDECIQKWIVQNVYNSILSRDTEAFNYLLVRLRLLSRDLKGLVPTPELKK